MDKTDEGIGALVHSIQRTRGLRGGGPTPTSGFAQARNGRRCTSRRIEALHAPVLPRGALRKMVESGEISYASNNIVIGWDASLTKYYCCGIDPAKLCIQSIFLCHNLSGSSQDFVNDSLGMH